MQSDIKRKSSKLAFVSILAINVLFVVFVYRVYQGFDFRISPIKYTIFSLFTFNFLFFLAVYIATMMYQIGGKQRLLLHILSAVLTIVVIMFFAVPFLYQFGLERWGAPINKGLVWDFIADRSSLRHLFVELFKHVKFILFALTAYVVGRVCFLSILRESSYLLNRKKHRLIIFFVLASTSLFVFLLWTLALSDYRKEVLVNNEAYCAFFIDPITETRIKQLEWNSTQIAREIDINESALKRNIVLISVDCLRRDHMSFSGYDRRTTPFIDSLYHSGSLVDYEITSSSCNSSFGGILSMLNGVELRNLGNIKFGIHDLLALHDYKTHFLLSGVHTDFFNLKFHYGPNIDVYKEGSTDGKYDNADDRVLLQQLEEITIDNSVGNFLFMHLMSPHTYGSLMKEHEVYKPDFGDVSFSLEDNSVPTQENIERWTNRYDNGIIQADYIIEEIFRRLKTKQMLSNSTIIITGDHGESLGEHGHKLGHGKGVYQTHLGIPILIYDPNVDKYPSQEYASQIDIASTIADRLQMNVPEHWDGISLTQKAGLRTTFHEQFDYASKEQHYAMISDQDSQILKLIWSSSSDTTLYNLTSDPEESLNLYDRSPTLPQE